MSPNLRNRTPGATLAPVSRWELVHWLLLFFLALAGRQVLAQSNPAYPTWWANYSVLSGSTADDYGACNQGQAKNIAVAAVGELDNDLSQFGGAGGTLDALAVSFTGTTSATDDYTAVNLGQLKSLAQPFYDRLLSLGYTLGPLSSGTYQWVGNGLSANDYAMGNIGQLKQLFSFDVTFSSANNGIPDWWIKKYFPGSTIDGVPGIDPGAFVTWSGSQVTNLAAYQQGLDPVDFYNGQTPVLAIVSGIGQIGSPGGFVPAPLIVSVTDTNGNPLYEAPVTFTVTSGTGVLQTSSTGAPVSTLTTLADQNGDARVFFQLPATVSSTSQITVTTGTTAAQAIFTEYCDDGTGTYQSPFAPSNVLGSMNADGSQTITWQNNDTQSPIYIYQLQSSGSWTVAVTLPAGTTTYIAPASTVGSVSVGNNYSPGGSTGNGGGGGGSGGSGGGGSGDGSGGSGGAGTNGTGDPGDAPFDSIPVQSYAVIDMSGTLPPTDAYASNVVLDDDNNAAFGFNDGNYYAYTWKNGTANLVQDFDTSTIQYDDQIFYSIHGGFLTAGGIYYADNIFATSDDIDPSTGQPDSSWTTAIQISDGVPTSLFSPDPPYAPGSPTYLYDELDLLDAKDYGYCGGAGGYVTTDGTNEGFSGGTIDVWDGGGIIVCSGSTTLFDPLVAISGGAGAGIQVVNASFTPSGMNANGWAYGYGGTDGSAQLWNGSNLVPLAPMQSPIAINDAGQIISSDGYLSTPGGQVQAISQLLPAGYQNELSDISYIDISGTDASGAVRILFDAAYQGDSDGYGYGTFMLTLASGTNPAVLQQVSIPSNVNDGLGYLPSGILNANGLIASTGGVDSPYSGHAFLLLPVQLTRHDATISGSDVILNDWPATASSPRSPKYLFAKNDSIKVTVPQIQGLQINVASETDPTGITFDPTQNTVQLSTTTGQQSGYVTIATKTKEVLTFSVVLNSSTSTGPTVMVARAKFASCAIQDFSGDANCCENDASSTNWFIAGNTVYPDDVGTDGRMATFIEESGDNSDGQASMLLAVCHGAPSGQLLDSDTNSRTAYLGNAVTLYTETGTYVYTPGAIFYAGGIYYPHAQQFTWDGDVEWVWLDACSTLNTTGGGEAAWTAMMSGTSRPVHAILGACLPVAGDLSEEINSFWSSADQYSEYLLNAYETGMQVGGGEAQPWAFIANNNDLSDKIKQVGPDGPAATTYSYLDAEVTVAGKAGGVGDSPIRGTFDSSNGILRTNLPNGNGVQLQKAKRMHPSPDLTKQKRLGFARITLHLPDGRQDFVGNGLVETLHQRTSITKDQAAKLATKYLADNFPEFASRSQLKKVSQRVAGTRSRSNGRNTTSWSNGYLVEFSITSGGIPVWNNYAAVTVRGDEIQNVSFRYYDEGGQAAAGQNNASIAPMAAGDCLSQALPAIKSSLGINGKYEVLKAELMYVNRAAAQGKEADLNEDVIPAWHLIVNSSYQGEGSKRTKVFHVWLDASTGEFIGKKPY